MSTDRRGSSRSLQPVRPDDSWTPNTCLPSSPAHTQQHPDARDRSLSESEGNSTTSFFRRMEYPRWGEGAVHSARLGERVSCRSLAEDDDSLVCGARAGLCMRFKNAGGNGHFTCRGQVQRGSATSRFNNLLLDSAPLLALRSRRWHKIE
jgi:hypothetical protein